MLLVALLAAEFIALPGGPPAGMDYLAYDAESGLLFVPASNTGKVDVIDTRTGKLKSIDGWKTENPRRSIFIVRPSVLVLVTIRRHPWLLIHSVKFSIVLSRSSLVAAAGAVWTLTTFGIFIEHSER